MSSANRENLFNNLKMKIQNYQSQVQGNDDRYKTLSREIILLQKILQKSAPAELVNYNFD